MKSNRCKQVDARKRKLLRVAFLLLCCGCIANPATAGEDKVTPTPLPSGYTLKFISSLLEQGPISDASATRDVIKRELGASLVEIPMGDVQRTWMASEWRLADEDARRLFPFQLQLTFGRSEFTPGQPRPVSHLFLAYWSTLCGDNYAVVSKQLRSTYAPNRYLDQPGHTKATKTFGKTFAELDLMGPDDNGKVFGINISSWETSR